MIVYCMFSVALLVIMPVYPEDIKDLNLNELLQLGQDISQVRTGDLKDDDVSYFFLNRNSTSLMPLDINTEALKYTNKTTKFIIHGWISTSRRTWVRSMTDEFLKNGDFNVVQVDWERIARTSYVSAAKDTKLIGDMIGRLIVGLGMLINNVHLVGHSLGAHIAGFAGKKVKELTGKKIGRISGLDPAGPVFVQFVSLKDNRLDKNDAVVVDIIHTDAGASGYEFPLGTLDIFVNGGRAPQPGCVETIRAVSLGEFLEHTYCSHEMSITYFIEWINSGKFHCIPCSSWQNFLTGNCERYLSIKEEDVDENLRGVCLARVHIRKPFLNK